QRRDVLYCLIKLFSVVYALAEHHLQMQLYAGVGQFSHSLHDISGLIVVEHHFPQLRVGRMDGNIYGRKVVVYYSLDVLVLHVCQSDVITLQKRKSCIIVLEVESLSHTLRELVDEAEYAFVAAASGVVHKSALKYYAKILVIVLFYLRLIGLAVSV